jgi:hypothetical protein
MGRPKKIQEVEIVETPIEKTEKEVYLIRVMDKDGTIKKIDPTTELNWRKKYKDASGQPFHF